MSDTDGNKDSTHSDSGIVAFLIGSIVLPLIIAIVTLVIEYRFFVHADAKTLSNAFTLHAGTITAVVSLVFISILCIARNLNIWFRQYDYFREDYSLNSLLTISFLTPTFMLMFLMKLMPWDIAEIIQTTIRDGRTISPMETEFADVALLVMLYIGTIFLIFLGRKEWDGGTSRNQYELDQQGESKNLLEEGVRELLRLIRRQPPLKSYQAINRTEYIKQLEQAVDSLAWKDQAKELLRLSSSSYAFDPIEDWHDKSGYWLGTNIDTGYLVGLFPAYSSITELEVENFFAYSHQFAEDRKKTIGELIVAIHGESIPASTRQYMLNRSIRPETESSLLDTLVDFRDYRNEIRRRVLFEYLPQSESTLENVYVPSNFYAVSEQKNNTNEVIQNNIEEYLYQWLDEPGLRQLALLAEYGQGKSTASLMLTYRMLFPTTTASSRIPILIELRGRNPRSQTPLGLLGDWASQYRIEPQALMRLLIAGRLLLIFEGFDEMALVGDTDMRLNHFKTLWKFCYPRAKILITGRPNFFLDEEEMKAALGINKPIGTQPFCQALRLAPFNLEQIRESLRTYNEDVREKICSFAQGNEKFLELIARPSILHIVAVLWEKENLHQQVKKLNSAYIMGLFISYSYRRQGLKEIDAPGFMALSNAEREYFMRGIAAYMASKRLPNQISGSQLNEVIEQLIEDIPEFEPQTISGETTMPLQRRLSEMQHGVEHVKTDVRTCGLLVDDPTSPGTFRFGHKSFMEYLFAAVLAEFINPEGKQQARAILKATGAQIEDILLLPVSIEFLAELVDSSQTDRGTDQELDSERDRRQTAFASQLFRAICGRGMLSYVHQRIALATETSTIAIDHLPFPWRGLAFILSPMNLMGLLTIGFLFFALSDLVFFSGSLMSELLRDLFFPGSSTDTISKGVSIEMSRSLRNINVPMYFVITMLVFFVQVFLVLMRTRRTQIIARGTQPEPLRIKNVFVKGVFGLWNYLCIRLGIRSQVLHGFAGTSFLPWARNQPFDYFLNQSNSRDETSSIEK